RIDSTSIRLDHTFGPKLALFFRFGDTPSSTQSRPNFAINTASIDNTNFTLGASSQFSNAITNEFRIGYSRADAAQAGVLDSFGGATPVDLVAAMGAEGQGRVNPVVVMYFGPGNPVMDVLNSQNAQRQWNLVDTVGVLAGHHTFKIGVDYRRLKTELMPPDLETYTYFSAPQQVLSGSPIVPYVIRYVSATPVFNETAVFVQDEWRVRPALSLSYGLRWEFDPPPTEQHGNNAYTLHGDISDPASLTLAPRNTPLWQASKYNVAPRFGVAWIVHNRPGGQTVVRAGGGAFFDSLNEVAALGYSGLGFRAMATRSGATLPFTANQLIVPIAIAPPYTAVTITAFPTHLQLPYTLQWNTSLQQSLGPNQSMTISYVAAEGRRLVGLQEK